jgi:hypothetical protein
MSLVLGVEILGEYRNLTAATKGAQTQLQKLNAGAARISSGMNRAFASIGIGFSLVAITRGLTSAVEAAEKVQQSDARLEQVAKSMGLFGDETAKVTGKLKKYADRLELSTGVEAETIKLAQAKLFTFKELGKTAGELDGHFDRATKAALDLAATGFGTAESNAVQLGKALQDPIKGITALARAGVTFTEEEKNKIAVLVEGNNLLAAQDLILQAIEQQVGGVAEATALSSLKIKNAFGQIEDALGLALLPLLDQFSNWLATPEGSARLAEIITFATDVLTAFGNIVSWIADNKDWLVPVVVAIGAVTTAFNIATAAAKVFQAAALLGIGGKAAGVAGLVGGGAAAGGFIQGQMAGQTAKIYGEGFTQLKKDFNKPKGGQTINVNVKTVNDAKTTIKSLSQFEKSTGLTLGQALRQ